MNIFYSVVTTNAFSDKYDATTQAVLLLDNVNVGVFTFVYIFFSAFTIVKRKIF